MTALEDVFQTAVSNLEATDDWRYPPSAVWGMVLVDLPEVAHLRPWHLIFSARAKHLSETLTGVQLAAFSAYTCLCLDFWKSLHGAHRCPVYVYTLRACELQSLQNKIQVRRYTTRPWRRVGKKGETIYSPMRKNDSQASMLRNFH